MDITKLLKKQHDEVKELFSTIEDEGVDSEEGEEALAEIIDALEMHAVIEERIFYPDLAKELEDKDMVEHALKEHAEVKQMISQIRVTEDVAALESIVMKLKEAIDDHVEEEEGELFPKAQELLGKKELSREGVQARKMEGEIEAGRIVPEEQPSPM